MRELFQDMSGRICMVTGANVGVGYETVLSLAKMDATVIMICRNENRGKKALQKIRDETGSNKIDFFLADLSDFNSVRKMVNDYSKKYKKLHVLVNNAGVFLRKRSVSVDGYEKTFATNHLGHFLLTNLLLDTLKKSAPSRVINVGADLYRFAKLDFNDINLEKKYSAFRAYNNSKLGNILFTFKLARILEGTRVTANVLHPGVFRSNFGKKNRDDDSGKSFAGPISNILMTSSEKAARTQIYLSISPEVETITGKYFKKCKIKKTTKITHDESLQDTFWELSKKMVFNF